MKPKIRNETLMNCNMCGREGRLVNSEVEGVILQVCKECARYGKIIPRARKQDETRSYGSNNRFESRNRKFSQVSSRQSKQDKKDGKPKEKLVANQKLGILVLLLGVFLISV